MARPVVNCGRELQWYDQEASNGGKSLRRSSTAKRGSEDSQGGAAAWCSGEVRRRSVAGCGTALAHRGKKLPSFIKSTVTDLQVACPAL